MAGNLNPNDIAYVQENYGKPFVAGNPLNAQKDLDRFGYVAPRPVDAAVIQSDLPQSAAIEQSVGFESTNIVRQAVPVRRQAVSKKETTKTSTTPITGCI